MFRNWLLDAVSNKIKLFILFFPEVIIGRPKPRPGHIIAGPEPYVPPYSRPIPSKPIRFENDGNSIKHLLDPENPSNTSPPPAFTTPSYPILVTPPEGPKVEFDTANQIVEDFSQDPEHVSPISAFNLFYEETDKLKGKLKLVGGNYENYRPRT